MDKNIKKIIIAFIIVIILLPLVLNFALLFIDFVPSVGDDLEMFEAISGYLGGAIGGLATLIAIYYTFLKTKKDYKPMLCFHYCTMYYYSSVNGVYSHFSTKYVDQDSDVDGLRESLAFQLLNIGIYPAVEIVAKITKMGDFLESAKLLKLTENEIEDLNNSYVKEDQGLFRINVIKQNDSVVIPANSWFEFFVNRLIQYNRLNNSKKAYVNNNHFVNGEFKLFDIQINYKDIEGTPNEDIYSVYVKFDQTIQLTTKLKNYEPWTICFSFLKKKTNVS